MHVVKARQPRQRPAKAGAMAEHSKTTILIQDECYKHRYIRTKDVSLIVERPERLRALKVGFAAAIARLEELKGTTGSNQTEGILETQGPVDAADELTKALDNLNIAPKQQHVNITDVCEVSRLPVTLQYLSSDPAVRMIHAANADGEGYDNMEHLDRLAKWARESEENIRVKGSEIPEGFSQGDLYMCKQSYSAICGAVETMRTAVDKVMTAGEEPANVFAAIRPPGHHCGEDTPSGFCFVNNVAIAAAHAHLQHGVKRVIIFDIDLHHGNGTQAIAWGINAETHRKRLEWEAKMAMEESNERTENPRGLQIFYASLHDILSFPCEDGDANLVRDASVSLSGAHGQFIENMHLQPYATHDQFWNDLYPHYCKLFDKASDFLKLGSQDTNVPIFISCGFDASELEYESMSRHGRKVPVGFYYRFAKDAREFSRKHANGKIVSVLEGGYSDRTLIAGGLAHLVGLIEEGEGTVAGPNDWWDDKSLDMLEKATKKRKGKQSIGTVSEGWVERAVEILAAIDPPQSAKPSPPQTARKLPSAQDGPVSTLILRERKKAKTPPPRPSSSARSHDTTLDVPRSEASTRDAIGRRKSPRKSDIVMHPTRDPLEVAPVEEEEKPPAVASLVRSASHDSSTRIPWHEWQQSNPDRKLPRLILKVREPGT